VKLLSKERIGSKTKKTHDEAKTPYERVMESDAVLGGHPKPTTDRHLKTDHRS